MIYIFVAVAVIILLVFIIIYNSLIQKKNAIDNAYFSMDVMLKKRYDLIPQLVETVKGYMNHEKEVSCTPVVRRPRTVHAASRAALALCGSGSEVSLGDSRSMSMSSA